jgi:hypothetical protein
MKNKFVFKKKIHKSQEVEAIQVSMRDQWLSKVGYVHVP